MSGALRTLANRAARGALRTQKRGMGGGPPGGYFAEGVPVSYTHLTLPTILLV